MDELKKTYSICIDASYKGVARLSVKMNRAIIMVVSIHVIDNQCIGINGRVTLKFTRPRYN